jgi:hypothetical protein
MNWFLFVPLIETNFFFQYMSSFFIMSFSIIYIEIIIYLFQLFWSRVEAWKIGGLGA